MSERGSYEDDVFLNCPLDESYESIFRGIVFAVHDCGFRVRCALEIDDASQVRIAKIVGLISQCRLGIHDLSRTELDPQTNLPRFNMPLELGVFLGAKWVGSGRQKNKCALILDREKYRVQKFCSDIAGQDIRGHNGDPAGAISRVRDWLRSIRPEVSIPGATKIVERHNQFLDDLPLIAHTLNQEPSEITYNDFTTIVVTWLRENPW